MTVCTICGHGTLRAHASATLRVAARVQRDAVAEQRKTVTVLFCDVTGSTALGERLDPESLRACSRATSSGCEAVERHGGTVEKFIGDAVMAVFGVPAAARGRRAAGACGGGESGRLAAERRARPRPRRRAGVRIGVNTGEVVTGTEERLATGDAVNVAARLEQAAQPGEILLGEETFALVARRGRGRARRAARR